jgi:ethanolamine utilization microcompartment shell protein EutS
MNYLTDIEIAPSEGFRGFGKLGLEGESAAQGIITFTDFISSAIGLMTIIAIIWFIFTLFTGAISYITSGGDKGAVESARKRIITGFTGLVITIAAIFVIRLFGYLIGIPDILNILSLFGKATGDVVTP